MKRSGIRKKSKSPLAKAKQKLWSTLKLILDIRDGPNCISCSATGLVGHNKHGGHWIASAACGGFLRYDLRNVHNQCARDNLFFNGAGPEYTIALQKKYGKEFVQNVLRDKNVVIKLDIHFINKKIKEYESYLSLSQKELIKLTKNYNKNGDITRLYSLV